MEPGHPSKDFPIMETNMDIQECEAFGAHLYGTVIKRNIKFSEASRARQPLLQFAGESDGAPAYRQLAQEVLEDAQASARQR